MKRLIFVPVLLCFGRALGDYTNVTLNISACGGAISGDRYTSIGSLVPVGGQTSQSGTLCNYSGFAAGFILQPKTAFSGLADEWNPDNDRDGLLDGDEIMAGSSLYNSDTDGDGLSDPNELVAGTSPTNCASVLSVTCIFLPDGQKELSWFGVQGRTYTFQYCDSLKADWQSHPSEITGAGATISFTDSANLSNRFYRVKVRTE